MSEISQVTVSKDTVEAQTWTDPLTSLLSNLNRIRHQIVAITGETWGTVTNPLVDYTLKSLFNANTILYATTDNTPVALSVAEQRILGRITGGNIAALTQTQMFDFINSAGDIPAARIQAHILAAINASTEADKIDNAQLDDIAWAKVTKTGSSLADLITRSAGDLSSGDLAAARMSANIIAAIAGLDPTFTSLIFDSSAAVQRDINTDYLTVCGGTDKLSGASVSLKGGDRAEEGGYADIYIGDYGAGQALDSKFRIVYMTNGTVTARVIIDKSGNIATSGVYDDTVAGTANVIVSAGGHLQRATSGEKEKKDIKDLDIDTARIFQLRSRSFKWDHKISELREEAYPKSDKPGKIIRPERIVRKNHVGLIAEEVEAVFPEAASHNIETNEPDGIEWNTIIVALLAEVTKLRNEVDELKGAN